VVPGRDLGVARAYVLRGGVFHFTPRHLFPVPNPNPAESALAVKDHQRLVGHALISVGCIPMSGWTDSLPFSIDPLDKSMEVIESLIGIGATLGNEKTSTF